MSDNILNNESFKQLERYLDEDLIEVLSDDQRDHIYALAASSIALDVRHKTTNERVEAKISAARMENLALDEEPAPIEYGCKWWICKNKYVVIAASVVTAICLTYAFI